MNSTYRIGDLAFAFPENWRVDDDEPKGGAGGVTVYSPDGAFWSVRLESDAADPAQLTEAAVQVMREEYEDLDAEAVTEAIGDDELVGADMNFYCLDLTSTAQIRVLSRRQRTYLILCQAEDREFERVQDVFRAMTTSLVMGS